MQPGIRSVAVIAFALFGLAAVTLLQAEESGHSGQLNLMQRYFTSDPNLSSLTSKPAPGENVLGEWVAVTEYDFQSVIEFHTADGNLGKWQLLSRQPSQLYRQQRDRELFIMLSRQDGRTRIKYRYLDFDC